MGKKNALETVDLKDVEILAPGTWHGSKDVTLKLDDIKAFVEAFDEISADEKVNYEPPVKLGHDGKQKLLQADGYPSAGWVSALKEKAGKLVADITGVPKKLAEIISAGGYKKVSAEFYQNYDPGNGKAYPWVLKAIAFLGADVPAVKSIGDIAAQYAEGLLDDNKVPFVAVLFEESLDAQSRMIRDAFYQQTRPPMTPTESPDRAWVREVYPDYVIVENGAALYQIPYTVDEAGAVAFDMVKAVMVKQVYQPITQAEKPNEMAEWDTAYINNLPDSCFAVIKSGGEKDEEGKTKPRSLRMLPYKGMDGKVDLPHLRNALARLPQSDLTPEEKAAAEKKLQAAAKEAGVGEDKETKNQEAIVEKELRTLLGLDDKADVLATVKTLKEQAGNAATVLAERDTNAAELKTLKTKLAERERDERVSRAMQSGKVTPAQKPWADQYALSDPSGFDTFVAAAPVVVKTGEIGTQTGKETAPDASQLSEGELKVFRSMHGRDPNPEEINGLIKAKKQEVK
jgi:hypothetical protein